MPKAKRPPVPIITEDELRSIIASVAMECGEFTPAEIEELRRVAWGEITVAESVAAITAQYKQGQAEKRRK